NRDPASAVHRFVLHRARGTSRGKKPKDPAYISGEALSARAQRGPRRTVRFTPARGRRLAQDDLSLTLLLACSRESRDPELDFRLRRNERRLNAIQFAFSPL